MGYLPESERDLWFKRVRDAMVMKELDHSSSREDCVKQRTVQLLLVDTQIRLRNLRNGSGERHPEPRLRAFIGFTDLVVCRSCDAATTSRPLRSTLTNSLLSSLSITD